MEVVDGMHARQIKGGWSHVGICWGTSRIRSEDTHDTRSHRHPSVQLWVRSRWNWSVFLERSYLGMPREGSSSLSMLPVNCTPWCSTDAVVVEQATALTV